MEPTRPSSAAIRSSEIRRLKAQPGGDIVQYGFGRLSHALMEHGLLDELRLWVHPLFVGTGGPDDLIYRDGPGAHVRAPRHHPARLGDRGPELRSEVTTA